MVERAYVGKPPERSVRHCKSACRHWVGKQIRNKATAEEAVCGESVGLSYFWMLKDGCRERVYAVRLFNDWELV